MSEVRRTGSAPVRRGTRLLTVAVVGLSVGGCSVFGGGGSGKKSQSVFSIKPGQCFVAPTTPKAQLGDLTRVSCTKPHTEEAYANPVYAPPPAGASSGASVSGAQPAYPGADVLTTYAQGACAQEFKGYVGLDYLDSTLFFTYLLPSARSWDRSDDRTVTCFVVSGKGPRSSSAKNARI